MISEATAVKWVDVLPGGGFNCSVEGFLLVGLIACHEAPSATPLHDVINRLGRKALQRGCKAVTVRRLDDMARRKRLPNKARTFGVLVALADHLTVDDVLAEIDRAL